MLIRIVKLTFQEDKIDDFVAIYKKYRKHIRNAEGCTYVELLQNESQKNIFFTYSHWKNESYLNNYKNSTIFGEVWPQTKALFSAKPEAWSTSKIDF